MTDELGKALTGFGPEDLGARAVAPPLHRIYFDQRLQLNKRGFEADGSVVARGVGWDSKWRKAPTITRMHMRQDTACMLHRMVSFNSRARC